MTRTTYVENDYLVVEDRWGTEIVAIPMNGAILPENLTEEDLYWLAFDGSGTPDPDAWFEYRNAALDAIELLKWALDAIEDPDRLGRCDNCDRLGTVIDTGPDCYATQGTLCSGHGCDRVAS